MEHFALRGALPVVAVAGDWRLLACGSVHQEVVLLLVAGSTDHHTAGRYRYRYMHVAVAAPCEPTRGAGRAERVRKTLFSHSGGRKKSQYIKKKHTKKMCQSLESTNTISTIAANAHVMCYVRYFDIR